MMFKRKPKTPIWIKDRKTGHYDRIPYDKMIQQPDGKWYLPSYQVHTPHFTETWVFVSSHQDHFDYVPNLDVWVFCPNKNRLHRAAKLASAAAAAAAGVNFVVCLTDLWVGAYMWAGFNAVCMAVCVILPLRLLTLRGCKDDQ